MPDPAYLDPRTGRSYPISVPRWCGDDQTPLLLTRLRGLTRGQIDTSERSLWRYRAALPLSSRTLNFTAGIIRRHLKSIGSRWRKLNPGQEALLVLAYLRKGETFDDLAAGFGVGASAGLSAAFNAGASARFGASASPWPMRPSCSNLACKFPCRCI